MRILVVSDGRRGIENQALGLAEAVARHHEREGETASLATHLLSHRPAFAALPPSLQLLSRSGSGLPEADLVIGCGRQAVAPLIGLRRSGSPAFTVYVQDPRTEPSRFDLVVAPEHDGLSGPFVETMIGSPNRITRDRIVAETLGHAERLGGLPLPRAAILLGGTSKTRSMSREDVTHQLQAARELTRQGYSLMVTASRRTPDAALDAWQTYAVDHPAIWLHGPDSNGPNPYFAFLGGADVILVTEDSTNMLTEACATGKPTYRLPMSGTPGKFAQLYHRLETRCGVRPFNGTLDVADYPPLDETDRVAGVVLERMRSEAAKTKPSA
ncbi:MAG: mitochondrial fission ELM1 family protein [Litorimonas sp.]